MPLGTEVGLGPTHIVVDGTQLPLKRDTVPLTFRPMSIVAKRLDGSRCHLLYTEVDFGPSHTVLNGDTAAPVRGRAVPLFLAHVYCGQTVAHLSYC